MGLSGYSKIERDETDISLKRLQQIAEVLETDYNSILSFDKNQVFNLNQNQSAEGTQNAYAIIQNQQLNDSKGMERLIEHLQAENIYLRNILEKVTTNTK